MIIIDNSVITYDEIIEVTKNLPTKTFPLVLKYLFLPNKTLMKAKTFITILRHQYEIKRN